MSGYANFSEGNCVRRGLCPGLRISLKGMCPEEIVPVIPAPLMAACKHARC